MREVKARWLSQRKSGRTTSTPSMTRYGGIPVPHLEPMPDGLELLEDLSPAGWIKESLSDWARVRSFLPSGFQSYARVFHPASLDDGTERRPVRWPTVTVASWSGTTVHIRKCGSNVSSTRT